MKFLKFIKTKNTQPKDIKTNSLNQNLDKLIDGELPFRWIYHHKELKEYDSELVELALKAKDDADIDSRIKAYKDLIEKFYSLKNYCYNKNECYKKYFSDYYEHCHNSTNKDFCYITPYEKELDDIITNYDKKIKEYKDKLECQQFSKDKIDEIFLIIKNTPGISQKDLKNMYNKKFNLSIDSILFQLTKNHKIRKEKSGNTNKLFIL